MNKIFKSLPVLDIIEFSERLLSIKDSLQNGKHFSIDDAITKLSLVDKDTFYYKFTDPDIMKNVGERKYKQKCDVLIYLRRIMNPQNKSRPSLKRLENFFILTRIGNGKYTFIENASKIVRTQKKIRNKFLSESRIGAKLQ